MRLLVSGATGFLGRHLVGRLIGEGGTVRILTRDPGKVPSDWIGKVDIVTGSLLDSDSRTRAVEKCLTVFHLAGETRDEGRMQAVNVDATQALAEAAAAAGVRRIIHVSSVGVFGADAPGTVTEATPCRPKTAYERTKLDGEGAVLRSVGQASMDAVIFRPTIVFGERPGAGADSLLAWLRAIQAGWFVYIGSGAIANYVYVGDVVEAMVQVAQRDGTGADVYIVADPASMDDFVAAAADALKVPRPTRRVPLWVGLAAGLFCDGIARATGRSFPLSRSRARALSNHTRFVGDKLLHQAGIRLPFGYREGLRRTIEAYQKEGMLPSG